MQTSIWQNPIPFLVKKKHLTKIRLEGNYLYIKKKAMCKIPTANNPQWWNTKSFFFKIKNKAKMPLSPHIFNIVLEVLARENKQEKEIKDTQTGNEQLKLSL